MSEPSVPHVSIRHEQPDDVPVIREVLEAAFGRHNEADLVDTLREADSLAISLVAVTGEEMLGHIAFSPLMIVPEVPGLKAYGLGPIAVFPPFQRKGVGSKLVRRGVEECRHLACGAIFVLGEPAYYHRFGFKDASRFGLHCRYDVPSEAFMALELRPGALAGGRGMVHYRLEFDQV